jgi:hypothetical protein
LSFSRKTLVSKLGRKQDTEVGKPGILYADHLRGAAVELFRVCCAQDLEGIVIKAARAPYSEVPRSWLNVLNPDYTQKRGRREMFEKFHEREHNPSQLREIPT